MFKIAKPLFLIVETPLHAGSGNDLGIVDLPIQREKHTDYPKIEASGLKGSLREIFEAQEKNLPTEFIKEFNMLNSSNYKKQGISFIFGPDKGELHAGALGFTDARLLLFPVKSVKGVFAWITCPYVLERFRNDLKLVKNFDSSALNDLDNIENTVPLQSGLILKDNKIVLEEYTIEVEKDQKCEKLCKWLSNTVLPEAQEYKFWRDKMLKDVVVLSNDDFRDFVMLSTEVIARTKIDDKTGTVEKGGLWYEEYLPSDSILYSLALATPVFNKDGEALFPDAGKVMTFFEKGLPSVIQIGGNATLGKGLVHTRIGGQDNGK